MTFSEYLSILRARRKTVFITLAVTVALAIILSLVIPNHYKGIATVVPDLKVADPLDPTALPGGLVSAYQGTQIDIIQSDRVARKVVERLKLAQRPELVEKWHGSFFYSPDNFVPWAVEWLHKKLTVDPSRDSSVIEIKFSSIDSQLAVDAANAFADAYLEANLELNVEPARDSAAWFEELTKPLRASLEAAQSKLSAFQQAHGIVATDDRIDVENTRLTELEQQLVTAQGQYADSSSRQTQANRSVNDLPEVLQSPLITGLKTDIARDEALLEDLAARLGTSHPQYVSMQTQLASLKTREAAEVERVVGSLGSNNRVSVGREQELRAAIGTQKSLVLELRSQHDEAAVLQRDVDAAQRAYDLVTQRLAQSTLEGQLRQTNVTILSKATPPFKRSWPILWLDTFVGLFIGSLLGIGLALLMEYLDLRIHSTEQLTELTNAPAFAIDLTFARAANDSLTAWSRAGNLLASGRRILRIKP